MRNLNLKGKKLMLVGFFASATKLTQTKSYTLYITQDGKKVSVNK